MKLIHKISLLLALLLVMVTPAFADNNDGSNNEEAVKRAQNSYIEVGNEPILVPVRFVSESIDAEIKWEEEEKKITVVKGENIVEMNINSSDVYINGDKMILDKGVTPKLVNENTMVPLVLLNETFDYQLSASEAKEMTSMVEKQENDQKSASASVHKKASTSLVNDLSKTVLGESKKHRGTRYASGGNKPGGFDCSGLVQWSYKKAGINLPRSAKAQWSATEKISKDKAQPGDLVFFKGTYGGANHISHVAIYVDASTICHSSSSKGVCYSNFTSGYWKNHFDSIRRVK